MHCSQLWESMHSQQDIEDATLVDITHKPARSDKSHASFFFHHPLSLPNECIDKFLTPSSTYHQVFVGFFHNANDHRNITPGSRISNISRWPWKGGLELQNSQLWRWCHVVQVRAVGDVRRLGCHSRCSHTGNINCNCQMRNKHRSDAYTKQP